MNTGKGLFICELPPVCSISVNVKEMKIPWRKLSCYFKDQMILAGWLAGWLAGLGWAGLGWAGLGWAGLGWAGLGWAGLGWAGLG